MRLEWHTPRPVVAGALTRVRKARLAPMSSPSQPVPLPSAHPLAPRPVAGGRFPGLAPAPHPATPEVASSELAAQLQRRGWTLVEQDYISPAGRLDAIATNGRDLLIVIDRPGARTPIQPGGRRMREARRAVACWLGARPPQQWRSIRFIDSFTLAQEDAAALGGERDSGCVAS